MRINSDINVLGSLPDWGLIEYFYKNANINSAENQKVFTHIKTDKSIKRFEKAIKNTFLTFKNDKIKFLFDSLISHEGISQDLLFFIFWNASLNNDLLNYINQSIFFKAYYSGRASIRYEEIEACLSDLKNKEQELSKWSISTLKTTASKYLTLLKKFGLLEGRQIKSILHPFLNDKMFIIFVYWIVALEDNSNILNSDWLSYSFMEKQTFVERLKNKHFVKYYNIYYTGDKLKIDAVVLYERIYDIIARN